MNETRKENRTGLGLTEIQHQRNGQKRNLSQDLKISDRIGLGPRKIGKFRTDSGTETRTKPWIGSNDFESWTGL